MEELQSYKKNRETYEKQLKEAKKQLKDYDLKFFSGFVEKLFKKYPLIKKISWCQGYMYNDQYDVFSMIYLNINDIQVSYWVNSYSDEDLIEDLTESKLIEKISEETLLQIKKCASEFSSLVKNLVKEFGLIYFVENFGHIGEIIFEPGQFTVKEYQNTNNREWLSKMGYLSDTF